MHCVVIVLYQLLFQSTRIVWQLCLVGEISREVFVQRATLTPGDDSSERFVRYVV
jgi:hypothetical protein